MSDKVCAIIGAGPGNGAAFAHKFADEGYRVAVMSRSLDNMAPLAEKVGGRAYAVDARKPDEVKDALEQVAGDLGPVDTLLYNAGAAAFGSIEDIGLDILHSAWALNTLGLAAAAQAVGPSMVERGGGVIAITGATASVRGGAGFAAFASAKAAQRMLAQSMARHWGPKGIHVSYLVVDGVINMTRTRALEFTKDWPEEAFLQPADIAETVYHVCHQPRSAWTFEYDIRPFGEKW